MRANETYSEAKCQSSVINRDVRMNAESPHYICCVCLSSSLPPLVGGGDGLVCVSVGKVDLLSVNFDCKQSMVSLDLPLTGHLSLLCSTGVSETRQC